MTLAQPLPRPRGRAFYSQHAATARDAARNSAAIAAQAAALAAALGIIICGIPLAIAALGGLPQ